MLYAMGIKYLKRNWIAHRGSTLLSSPQKAGALPIPTEAHGVNYHNPPMEGGYSFFMPRRTLFGFVGIGLVRMEFDVVNRGFEGHPMLGHNVRGGSTTATYPPAHSLIIAHTHTQRR